MNRFDQAFHSFDDAVKKHIPLPYNFLYYFNKRGIVKKKGDAYYGVPVSLLNTNKFYAWGHPKPISKILDFSVLKLEKKQAHEPSTPAAL